MHFFDSQTTFGRTQEAHAPTTNVHHTLLFAVLLNNEDGNCLINQAWIPFGMSHWQHFRMWTTTPFYEILRSDLVYKAINTYQQTSWLPVSVNVKWENPIIYGANFTQCRALWELDTNSCYKALVICTYNPTNKCDNYLWHSTYWCCYYDNESVT